MNVRDGPFLPRKGGARDRKKAGENLFALPVLQNGK